MYCSKCGEKSLEGAGFCAKCGHKHGGANMPQATSAPIASAVQGKPKGRILLLVGGILAIVAGVAAFFITLGLIRTRWEWADFPNLAGFAFALVSIIAGIMSTILHNSNRDSTSHIYRGCAPIVLMAIWIFAFWAETGMVDVCTDFFLIAPSVLIIIGGALNCKKSA